LLIRRQRQMCIRDRTFPSSFLPSKYQSRQSGLMDKIKRCNISISSRFSEDKLSK
jgi:hypothetical protein